MIFLCVFEGKCVQNEAFVVVVVVVVGGGGGGSGGGVLTLS